MDIWIIRDGEKHGPLRDYDVRGQIQSGALTADVPAWHEGLDGWRPLGEIPIFKGDFERLHEKPETQEPVPVPSAQPPPLPGVDPHLIRRFWARWFDLYLYAGVWWICMWAAGRDIGAILSNPWIILFHYVPWFVLEAIFLQRFGTTPGKWLLGIRVFNEDGSKLDLRQATLRSSRVIFLGIGFGWGILALICQIMAFITTKRLGRPLWDHAGGHRLSVTPLNPIRIAAYVIGLFLALQLQMIVVAPYVIDGMKKTFPSMREQIEKNPPWHLPPNHRK